MCTELEVMFQYNFFILFLQMDPATGRPWAPACPRATGLPFRPRPPIAVCRVSTLSEAGCEAGREAGHEAGREAGCEASREAGREDSSEAGSTIPLLSGSSGTMTDGAVPGSDKEQSDQVK